MNVSIKTSDKEAIYLLGYLSSQKNPPVCLLGNVLCVLKDSSIFKSLDGYFSWLSSEYGIEKRKAYNLIEFSNKMADIGASIDKVMASKLGWTHLVLLTPVINAENLDYWLDRACQLTTAELKKEVGMAKAA
ncbi:MAG: hypothetical protein H7839_19605 [Magnetococcus sp. YQC-5]